MTPPERSNDAKHVGDGAEVWPAVASRGGELPSVHVAMCVHVCLTEQHKALMF